MPKEVYTKEQIRKKRQQASSALHRVQAAGNRSRSTPPKYTALADAVQKTVSQGLKAADEGYRKLHATQKIAAKKAAKGTTKAATTGWGLVKNSSHRYNQ